MPKYEAVINLTVEVEAKDSETADQLFLGELTDRILETASRDDLFQMWLEVREIDGVL